MVVEKSGQIIREIGKVLVGKEAVVEKVLMTIYAGGHILLEDAPGVGKTTMALAFSKALGLEYKRVQFTPDTLPSDIIGFSTYDRETGSLVYRSGAVMCHLFLGGRDQPYFSQDAVGAAGSHGRAKCDSGWCDSQAALSVHLHSDTESAGVCRNTETSGVAA